MSFGQIAGAIGFCIAVLNASGHGDFVWKAVAEIRKAALVETMKPWGCPTIFNKNACREYDPSRYR